MGGHIWRLTFTLATLKDKEWITEAGRQFTRCLCKNTKDSYEVYNGYFEIQILFSPVANSELNLLRWYGQNKTSNSYQKTQPFVCLRCMKLTNEQFKFSTSEFSKYVEMLSLKNWNTNKYCHRLSGRFTTYWICQLSCSTYYHFMLLVRAMLKIFLKIKNGCNSGGLSEIWSAVLALNIVNYFISYTYSYSCIYVCMLFCFYIESKMTRTKNCVPDQPADPPVKSPCALPLKEATMVRRPHRFRPVTRARMGIWK